MKKEVFCKNSDVITRKVAGELILVPIRGNIANMQHIFTLTPVAECIWELIDGKTSVEQIILSVMAEFDVDSVTAESDSVEFLQSLAEHGLIRVSK